MPSSKGKPTDPKLREEVKEGMLPLLVNNGFILMRANRREERNQQGWKRKRSDDCVEGMSFHFTPARSCALSNTLIS